MANDTSWEPQDEWLSARVLQDLDKKMAQEEIEMDSYSNGDVKRSSRVMAEHLNSLVEKLTADILRAEAVSATIDANIQDMTHVRDVAYKALRRLDYVETKE